MSAFANLFTAAPQLRWSIIDLETGQAFVTSAPTGDVAQRSAVLPVGRDHAGRLVPSILGIIMSAVEAAGLPDRVARGETSIFDQHTDHVFVVQTEFYKAALRGMSSIENWAACRRR